MSGEDRVAISNAASKLRGSAPTRSATPTRNTNRAYLNMIEIPHVETHVCDGLVQHGFHVRTSRSRHATAAPPGFRSARTRGRKTPGKTGGEGFREARV